MPKKPFFNISQRKNNIGYSFGVSNSYQSGIIPSTGLNRTGARAAVDYDINDEWKTGFSANYTSTKITSAPGANNGVVNVVYGAPAEYNLAGTPTHYPNDPTKQVSYRATNFNNPYWWSNNDEFRQHTNRVFGNAYFEYSPKLGVDYLKLTFREQAGLDVYTTDNMTTAEVGSAYNTKGEVEDYGVQRNIFNNLMLLVCHGMASPLLKMLPAWTTGQCTTSRSVQSVSSVSSLQAGRTCSI